MRSGLGHHESGLRVKTMPTTKGRERVLYPTACICVHVCVRGVGGVARASQEVR